VYWEASSAPGMAKLIAIRIEILAAFFVVCPAAAAAPKRVTPGHLFANEQASS
jgi:hypothetical protein